jgi:hypothetical protein
MNSIKETAKQLWDVRSEDIGRHIPFTMNLCP